jgi:hypothetical protein
MRYEIRELDIGGILDQGVALLKNHFGVLFGIVGAIFIPFTILTGVVQLVLVPPPPPNSGPDVMLEYLEKMQEMLPILGLLGIVNGLLVMPWTQAAMVDAVARLYLGQEVTIGGALSRAAGRIPALIGTWILLYLAVLGGLILLIVPGIIFLFWFSLATQVVVVEKLAGSTALGRSRELMKGNMGKAFVLGLLLFVIAAGLGFVGALVPNVYVQFVLNTAANAVAMLLSVAVFVVLYFSARCQHEDFDLELLARDVDVAYDETDDPRGEVEFE